MSHHHSIVIDFVNHILRRSSSDGLSDRVHIAMCPSMESYLDRSCNTFTPSFIDGPEAAYRWLRSYMVQDTNDYVLMVPPADSILEIYFFAIW